MNFEEELKIRREGVEQIIQKYLPQKEGYLETLTDACNYGVLCGGKRLRPMIMQETYALFDGHSKVIEPFMAAIECIHSGSLIHDDLPCIDNDELRRGKPSTWAKYGADIGTMAGDGLFFYAFEVACKAFQFQTSTTSVGKALEVLAHKSGIYGMVGGETLDIQYTGKQFSEDVLYSINSLKTAALLEASMMCGAILANASFEDVELVEKIAHKVGIAFQIQDDILDEISTTEVLGKPIHSDERNQKVTFVSLHGLEEARKEVQKLSEEAIELLHSVSGENAFLEELLKSLIEREK